MVGDCNVTQVNLTQPNNGERNERTREYFSQHFSQALGCRSQAWDWELVDYRVGFGVGFGRPPVVIGGTHIQVTDCESSHESCAVNPGNY